MIDEKNIYVIMQARIGSTRLPGKILKEILGKSVLEITIERLLYTRNIDGVIVATTHESDSQLIIDICQKFNNEKVKYFQGSTDDVLARYYESAKRFDVDVIVRVTSDCPLIDPDLLAEMIDEYFLLEKKGEHFALLTNNLTHTYPHGLDAEIFSFKNLEFMFNEAADTFEREHVTPFIRRHPEEFRIINIAQEEDHSFHRWTLDYIEDFEFIKAVFERLYPSNPKFTRHDVIDLLKKHPHIFEINQSRRQR